MLFYGSYCLSIQFGENPPLTNWFLPKAHFRMMSNMFSKVSSNETFLWFWWKKPKQEYGKFFFQLSNLSQSAFLLENPTHWALETAVCPIFAKPVLDIFTVFSRVPRMNLSQSQQGYLCQKNQNYLLEKAYFMFFFSYGLRTSIKITTFNTFYVTDNVLSCCSRSSCKKIQTLSKKLFSK